MSKCRTTWHAQESGLGMFMYVHGDHLWVWMGAGEHSWGLRHGKEAKWVADNRCQSCVHARTVRRQSKTRFGEEGQGWLVESRVRTGDMLWAQKPPAKTDKKRRKQKNNQNGKERNRQQAQTYLQKHNNTTHNLTQEKRKNKWKQRRQNTQCQINITPGHRNEKGKINAPKNAQKQQKHTAKNKARKQATKTTTLFVLSKTLQAPEKRREKCKQQQKTF